MTATRAALFIEELERVAHDLAVARSQLERLKPAATSLGMSLDQPVVTLARLTATLAAVIYEIERNEL